MMPGGSCSLNSVRDRRLVLVLMPFGTPYLFPTLEFRSITPFSRLCVTERSRARWVLTRAASRTQNATRGAPPEGIVTNIETGRAVAFVTFEGGRAIKEGANHAESSVPKVGLEPTSPLQVPDFESGTSASPVILETGCGDA